MNVGGQAVIEGVMMRNKKRFAVAVRTPNGEIKIKEEKSTKWPKVFDFPFMRGVVGLAYTLYDGVRALIWSSNQQLEKEEELTKKEIIGTIVLSFAFAITIFVVLPFFSARWIQSEGIMFDILDGGFRIALFLGYLLIISMMKDVKTLFQYHGAEHKAIYCNESGENLTLSNVKKYTRFHPRCGTSFLFIVLIISIVVFTLIPGAWYVKLMGRILLMPVVAGISYEIIKMSDKFKKNPVVRALISPGLWLQRITTKEPSDKQLEVGIASLKAVVD